ncbi:hypothetical protein [Pseudodesulfovibrio sp.]|uniref:hypothetical protein n=1 Tax=Pseudodesulfovibrio sp. TaxID=2035812 RepID=UPI00262A4E6D|nr:hypothetical protein [Pseudodesulfovibrio sp.]MDD3313021.1 hypothetical protein [Pseudodesulfovibrio sp.]
MRKRKNFDGQCQLPFDSSEKIVPADRARIDVGKSPLVSSLPSKILKFCSFSQLQNQKQENEAMKRILAHSEALDW